MQWIGHAHGQKPMLDVGWPDGCRNIIVMCITLISPFRKFCSYFNEKKLSLYLFWLMSYRILSEARLTFCGVRTASYVSI